MPGVLWYFVIALIVLVGVILAVPGDGAEIPRAPGVYTAART